MDTNGLHELPTTNRAEQISNCATNTIFWFGRPGICSIQVKCGR